MSRFDSHYAPEDDDDAAYQAWAEAQAEEYYAEMERAMEAAAEQALVQTQFSTILLP